MIEALVYIAGFLVYGVICVVAYYLAKGIKKILTKP